MNLKLIEILEKMRENYKNGVSQIECELCKYTKKVCKSCPWEKYEPEYVSFTDTIRTCTNWGLKRYGMYPEYFRLVPNRYPDVIAERIKMLDRWIEKEKEL